MSIKVLLADDTDIMRKAIRNLLSDEPEIELVGEAMDFSETIRLTDDLRPQVIVMDLHMPNRKNLTASDIKSHVAPAHSCLLAISVWDDEETKKLATSFGAKHLLDKSKLGTELIPAILQCA